MCVVDVVVDLYFHAEYGLRELVQSNMVRDKYKRQSPTWPTIGALRPNFLISV